MKIAILSSSNFDMLADVLAGKLSEFELEFYLSGFNQYAQEIINEKSSLYEFNPDIILLNINLFDLEDKYLYNILIKEYEEKKADYQENYQQIETLIKRLVKSLPDSLVLGSNFYYPPVNNNSLFNYNSQYDNSTIINQLNNNLFQLAQENINFQVVDFNHLLMKYGYKNLFDRRMWYLAKIPFCKDGMDKLADLYLSYIMAYTGKRKKAIVLDLDNTLWGGVIGDDGLENIKLSNDGPGKAFYDFQRVLLGLYQQGIILTICSKNTEEIALKAIKEHPYMVLKPEHFSVMKINWDNKVKNISEISQELNIGLDSLVFLDDSAFERDLVRQQLPEVVVPDLPKDFAYYPEFLMELPYFRFTDLTFTDKNRNKMYQDNKEREKLKNNLTSIEDYYHSLDMVVYINKIDEFALPRVTQLTQKTNQFNLTTKRYKISDLEQMRENDNYHVYYLELEDKFGSTGIVGVAIIELLNKQEALLDSFILSCRIMGRTVETAFLAYIAEKLAEAGIEVLYGDYFPTKKNQPVKDFYREHDFKQVSENRWEINLTDKKLQIPDWIEIRGDNNA